MSASRMLAAAARATVVVVRGRGPTRVAVEDPRMRLKRAALRQATAGRGLVVALVQAVVRQLAKGCLAMCVVFCCERWRGFGCAAMGRREWYKATGPRVAGVRGALGEHTNTRGWMVWI